jgi:hypothetical protein
MSEDFTQRSAGPNWWEPRRVTEGSTLDCHIGPLRLQICRAAGEWHIAAAHDAESGESDVTQMLLRNGAIEGEDFQRYMFSRDDDLLRLTPMLLDRPVVIRPRQPVFLPSGEETMLYMSSPIMVRVEAGDTAVRLTEVPAVRLSDTWFGASTRDGEVCYSGRTHARQHLEEVPRRCYRAITPTRIRNEADTPLPLDRLSLPVPALSIHGSADGTLWTEGVALVRGANSELAALHIDDAPPDIAGPVELLGRPRQPQSRGALVRAFSALFGEGQ